jgi:excinuclease ABC subunit B
MTPDQIAARLRVLEKQMYRHARDLEFEKAAQVRDEIALLRQDGLGLPLKSAKEILSAT